MRRERESDSGHESKVLEGYSKVGVTNIKVYCTLYDSVAHWHKIVLGKHLDLQYSRT